MMKKNDEVESSGEDEEKKKTLFQHKKTKFVNAVLFLLPRKSRVFPGIALTPKRQTVIRLIKVASEMAGEHCFR